MNNEIIEKINKLFIFTDQHRWEEVMNCFNEKVILDFSSFSGGEFSETTPAQIVEAWAAFLPKFKSTHHQISNFAVSQKDKNAEVFCYGTATHYFPNESNKNVWIVVGSYDFNLTLVEKEWKIDLMKFNFKYQDGNLELPKLIENKKKWK